MSAEIAILIALLYVSWQIERMRRVIRALVNEKSTARWERGQVISEVLKAISEARGRQARED